MSDLFFLHMFLHVLKCFDVKKEAYCLDLVGFITNRVMQ
jgi:hypothetical protein